MSGEESDISSLDFDWWGVGVDLVWKNGQWQEIPIHEPHRSQILRIINQEPLEVHMMSGQSESEAEYSSRASSEESHRDEESSDQLSEGYSDMPPLEPIERIDEATDPPSQPTSSESDSLDSDSSGHHH